MKCSILLFLKLLKMDVTYIDVYLLVLLFLNLNFKIIIRAIHCIVKQNGGLLW